MSNIPYSRRDLAIASEANRQEDDRSIGLCLSPGCKHVWTLGTTFGPDTRGLCSFHALAKDMLTEDERIRADAARARLAARHAHRAKGPTQRDPLDWARRLRAREALGSKLSPAQRQAWRDALRVTGFEDEPVTQGDSL